MDIPDTVKNTFLAFMFATGIGGAAYAATGAPPERGDPEKNGGTDPSQDIARMDLGRFPQNEKEVTRIEQGNRVDFYRRVEPPEAGKDNTHRTFYVARPIPLPEPFMGDTIVYFDHDVRTPPLGSENILGPIAEYLLKNPGVGITLTAHADRSGDEMYNQKLSEDRAGSVEAQMIAELERRGITDAVRRVRTAVLSSAHGENDNAVATDDGQKEPLNRRVSIAFNYVDPAELERIVTHHYLITGESCRNIAFSPSVSDAFRRQMEERHQRFVIHNGYGEVLIQDNQQKPVYIHYQGFTEETRDHFRFLMVGGSQGVYSLETGATPQQAQMVCTLPDGARRVLANISVASGNVADIPIGLTAPGREAFLMEMDDRAVVTPQGIVAISPLFLRNGSEVAGPDEGNPQTPAVPGGGAEIPGRK